MAVSLQNWSREGLSPDRIDRELEILSLWMDSRFRVPGLGWRFGLNAIIDLLPGIGDLATSAVAVILLGAALRYRVSKLTMARMALNIAIYFVAGLVPWAGDLFGAWWKPNLRNLALLRRRANRSNSAGRASDAAFLAFVFLMVLALLAGALGASYLMVRYILGRNF